MSEENNVEDANIDFALYNDQFKEAQVQESGGKVEDDVYTVVVDKVYPTRAKSSGNPLIKWELVIVSGKATGTKYANRRIFRQNMMTTTQNMSWLKTDFFRAGFTVESATDIPEVCKKMRGTSLTVTKKTVNNNDNVYINSVTTGSAAPAKAGSKDAVGEALGEFASSGKAPTPTPAKSEDLPF